MKIKNQSGFSVLHVLPVVALLAVIGVTGVKLMKPSHASSAWYCTVTWNSSGSTVYSRVNTNNWSRTKSYYWITWYRGATQIGAWQEGPLSAGASQQISRTFNGQPKGTYTAKVMATANGDLSTCSGTLYKSY